MCSKFDTREKNYTRNDGGGWRKNIEKKVSRQRERE